MLDGNHVIDAVADAYEEATSEPLEERLLAVIQADDDAGGDKRAGNA